MKRLLIISLLIFSLVIFCSCDFSNSDKSNTESQTVSFTEELTEKITIEETTVEETTVEETTVEETTLEESTLEETTIEETTIEETTLEETTIEETTIEETTIEETTIEETTIEETTIEETTIEETTIEETTVGETNVEETSSEEETSGECLHKDMDDNGKCDICSVSVIVYIDFYSINDLHGKFADTSSNCGVDELTTYLRNMYTSDENIVLLSAGDMWQGSSESNLTRGRIITDWMNSLGFASMTLGNHEYDWDSEFIIANDEIANFPLLAINIYDKNTNKLIDYCDSSVIIDRDGIQIGIIGAIGDCYSSISGDKSSEFYFKTGNELTELVKKESEMLRSLGADFIVYSIHDGFGSSSNEITEISDKDISSYYDIMLSDGYVDLVFEGHSHRQYVLIDSKGVYHLQGGGDNSGISHVEVKINSANNNSNVTDAEFISTYNYKDLADDPIVSELLDKYSSEIAKANEVLGYNESFRSSNEIKELVAKLYYKKGLEKWGSEYDIVLGGGFISTRSPYELGAGLIKYSDIQSILPFDNQLVLCSVKGSDLKSKFFETTNSNYFIYFESFGENVKNNIDPYATYYIITDTYSSTYSYNRLTEIERLENEIYARDLVADYIKNDGFSTYTSISEIISIGNALDENVQSAQTYVVKCKVEEITNTVYGNMIVSDGRGNTVTVYGASNPLGGKFETIEEKPQIGDTIILVGSVLKYKGANSAEAVIELYRTTFIGVLK